MRLARHLPDAGLTLLELTVTVAVVAVLAVGGIGVRHGAVTRAEDVAARSTLATAQLAIAAATSPTPAELGIAEPAVRFVDGPVVLPDLVSVATSDVAVGLATRTRSGACWLSRMGDRPIEVVQRTAAVCDGRAALALS